VQQKGDKLKQIPFFNYPELFKKDEQDYMEIIHAVLARGAYIMQSDLAEFEKELANFVGVKHAIGTADGTMAILASLLALDLEPGFEAILPSHTFVATASAVHYAGGVPVLADCGSDHLINYESIEPLVTDKTKVIIPVQLNGRVADMSPILDLARKYGLYIIEDSCQALGAKYKGQMAGTFGQAGAFSFYPSKTLGAFGDAGAIVTDSDEMAEKIKLIRDHGRNSETGLVERWGFNARLDNLHAAVLLYKLKKYKETIKKRRNLAEIYHNNLKEIDELVLPPEPSDSGEHYDIYQNYEIEAENREGLREYLHNCGVGTILQWGGNTIHQFKELNCRHNAVFTELLTAKFMLLPMNTTLEEEDVNYICDNVKEFYYA